MMTRCYKLSSLKTVKSDRVVYYRRQTISCFRFSSSNNNNSNNHRSDGLQTLRSIQSRRNASFKKEPVTKKKKKRGEKMMQEMRWQITDKIHPNDDRTSRKSKKWDDGVVRDSPLVGDPNGPQMEDQFPFHWFFVSHLFFQMGLNNFERNWIIQRSVVRWVMGRELEISSSFD